MMKHEFEERLGYAVPQEDYRIIEEVYMYHPICSCENPKQKIADIYRVGGIGLISEMLPMARKCAVAENTMRTAFSAAEKARNAYDELARNYSIGKIS